MIVLVNVPDSEALVRLKQQIMIRNPRWAVIERDPEVPFPKRLVILLDRKIWVATLEPVTREITL